MACVSDCALAQLTQPMQPLVLARLLLPLQVTNNHPLSVLGFYVFQQSGLICKFNLNPVALARFLRRVEEGYNENP